MDSEFTRYVILLSAVNETSASRRIVRDHVTYIRKLDADGKLVMCGPFTSVNGGMIIIRSNSMEEATKIAKSDPFVQSGARDFEVRSWELSCEANNHLGMG